MNRGRHKELFPFYRLGILLFLSLFFTAFSLSLFIAPNTAAPKKSGNEENIKRKAKNFPNHFPLTLSWKRRQSHTFRTSKYIRSQRPKIILQKNQEFMCVDWGHTQRNPPTTRHSTFFDVSIIKTNWIFLSNSWMPSGLWHIRLQHTDELSYRAKKFLI